MTLPFKPVRKAYNDPSEKSLKLKTPREERTRFRSLRTQQFDKRSSMQEIQTQRAIHPLQSRFACQTYGKSTGFSESFNSIMYQDNSLWAASRLQQRLNLGHEKREIKRERERAKI